MKYFFAIVVALLCTNIYAGNIDPYTSDSKYIEYGSKFQCVVKIVVKTKDSKTYEASAVVIDKNWILTAAHVVQGCVSAHIVNDHNNEYYLQNIIVHETFNEDVFGKADIALGYSKVDIVCDIIPQLYTNDDEVGKICSIAGYGLTGNFNTGTNKSDNKKRAGSNFVDKIDHDLLICSPSKPGEKNRTSLEFLICHGDSGGGLFINQKLAGINSCVIATDKKPNSSYGDESGHTRISLYIPWINKHIRNPPKISSQTNTEPLQSNNTFIILGILAISLNMIFFCLGYGWCKIISLNQENMHSSGFGTVKKNNTKTPHMQLATIDEKKVVVNIKTDGLEKKYDTLGDVKQTEDSINNSVNKLKNFRK